MKENNAKFEFLKNYIKKYKSTEDVTINDAWDMLSDFFNNLPKKTKACKERKDEFAYLTELFTKAFDGLVQKIANCPYVKIEICEQVEMSKLIQDFDKVKDEMAFLLGYCNNILYEEKVRKIKNEVSCGN